MRPSTRAETEDPETELVSACYDLHELAQRRLTPKVLETLEQKALTVLNHVRGMM